MKNVTPDQAAETDGQLRTAELLPEQTGVYSLFNDYSDNGVPLMAPVGALLCGWTLAGNRRKFQSHGD